jgi:hypothetical protein
MNLDPVSLLDLMPEAKVTKEIIGKLGYIKIQNSLKLITSRK